jgi:hypothetical protein
MHPCIKYYSASLSLHYTVNGSMELLYKPDCGMGPDRRSKHSDAHLLAYFGITLLQTLFPDQP